MQYMLCSVVGWHQHSQTCHEVAQHVQLEKRTYTLHVHYYVQSHLVTGYARTVHLVPPLNVVSSDRKTNIANKMCYGSTALDQVQHLHP